MKEFSFAQNWYIFALMAVICYFIGCFNFAILISKTKHKDVRTIGSGNPGTMNMFREFGWGIGFMTFFSDAFKGGIPAIISYFVFRSYVFTGTDIVVSDVTRYLCGACVIIGHIFPVTLKFKGGKGIASTLGLFWLCLACEKWWFLFLGAFLIFLMAVYILKIHWGSMGSLMGVTAFTVWQGIIFYLHYAHDIGNVWVIVMFMLLLLINVLTWTAHRQNILRLVSGEEHLTGAKHKDKSKKAV